MGRGRCFETIHHHLDAALEIGAHPVHLIDKGNPGNPIFIRLSPDRFRLGLHSSNRTEDRNRSIQNPEGSLDLNSKIHMAGGIDDIDPVIFPETGGRRRGDRDPSLFFLLHPVHGGRAFIHLSDFVGDAGIIENPLRRRRLPGVDVGHDANISCMFF